VPVVITSGVTESEAAGRVTDSVAFLQKPYELPQLREILRTVLGTPLERNARIR
jgi:hypothetical protein